MQLVQSEKEKVNRSQKFSLKKKKKKFEAKIEKLTSGFQSTCACSSVESIQTVAYNNQMHQNENDRPIEKQNKLTPRPQ